MQCLKAVQLLLPLAPEVSKSRNKLLLLDFLLALIQQSRVIPHKIISTRGFIGHRHLQPHFHQLRLHSASIIQTGYLPVFLLKWQVTICGCRNRQQSSSDVLWHFQFQSHPFLCPIKSSLGCILCCSQVIIRTA